MLVSPEMRTSQYVKALIGGLDLSTALDFTNVEKRASRRERMDLENAKKEYKLVKVSKSLHDYYFGVLPLEVWGRDFFFTADGEELPALFFANNGEYYAIRMKHTSPAVQAQVDAMDAYYKIVFNPRRATAYLSTDGKNITHLFFVNLNGYPEMMDADIVEWLEANGFTHENEVNVYFTPAQPWPVESFTAVSPFPVELFKTPTWN